MFQPYYDGMTIQQTLQRVRDEIHRKIAEDCPPPPEPYVLLARLAGDYTMADDDTGAFWVTAIQYDLMMNGGLITQAINRMLYRADRGMNWRLIAYPEYKSNRRSAVAR